MMKKFKKAIIIVIGLLMGSGLLLTGCSQPGSVASKKRTDMVEKIRERGVVKVGYLVWPPAVIKDLKSGKLTGIYPDMVNEIAKALGVKVQWVETSLSSFSAGLHSGQFDFSVGPTFITIPRSLAVSFTNPVALVGNEGVVRTNGNFRPKKLADLNKPGLRVAVLQGQAMHEFIKRNFPSAKLIVIPGGDLTAPLVAVSSGRADIGFMNSVTVDKYAKKHPEVSVVFSGENQLEILPLAWATRKEDVELLRFLDESITYLKITGRIAEYQRKYPTRLLYDVPNLKYLD